MIRSRHFRMLLWKIYAMPENNIIDDYIIAWLKRAFAWAATWEYQATFANISKMIDIYDNKCSLYLAACSEDFRRRREYNNDKAVSLHYQWGKATSRKPEKCYRPTLSQAQNTLALSKWRRVKYRSKFIGYYNQAMAQIWGNALGHTARKHADKQHNVVISRRKWPIYFIICFW